MKKREKFDQEAKIGAEERLAKMVGKFGKEKDNNRILCEQVQILQQ